MPSEADTGEGQASASLNSAPVPCVCERARRGWLRKPASHHSKAGGRCTCGERARRQQQPCDRHHTPQRSAPPTFLWRIVQAQPGLLAHLAHRALDERLPKLQAAAGEAPQACRRQRRQLTGGAAGEGGSQHTRGAKASLSSNAATPAQPTDPPLLGSLARRMSSTSSGCCGDSCRRMTTPTPTRGSSG